MAVSIVQDNGERRPGPSVDFDAQITLESNLITFVGGPHLAIQGWIICFPDQLASLDSAPIDISVAKPQRHFTVRLAVRFDLVNPAAFLAICRFACIKDDAIARFERRLENERD